jgi:hypothetical protein
VRTKVGELESKDEATAVIPAKPEDANAKEWSNAGTTDTGERIRSQL